MNSRLPGRMKVLIAGFLSCLIIGLTASAAPRMTIKENEFRFGFVPQNSNIAHPFWLYSTGDDTLKILKVTPG